MNVETNELEIISRIIAGETDLFALFVDKYGSPIFRMVKQIVTCNEDAEEVVQDVFLKVFSKLKSFKGESKFSTWLYRIAYNTAISVSRKKRRQYLFFNETDVSNIADETIDKFFDDGSNEQLISKLREKIELLNPDEKVLLSLYYNDDKSISEVASIVGLSEGNVKIKLYRIRKKLYLQIKN